MRPVLYCNDVTGLIEYLRSERELDDSCSLQVGIDGGGGNSLLVLWWYISLNELISIGFLKVGLLVKERYENSSAEVKSPTKGAESSPDKKKQKTKSKQTHFSSE